MDTTNKNDIEKIIEEAKIEAIKNLEGIINENQISYSHYLNEEIKRILAEKGIDWQTENNNIAIN